MDISLNSPESSISRPSRPVAVSDLASNTALDEHDSWVDQSHTVNPPQDQATRSAPTIGSRKPLAEVQVAPLRAWYLPIKGAADFLAALALLVVALPFIAIGALLVKLTSRGPAFYKQIRVGLGGRPFTLVKIRTMVQDAEAATGPVWSTGTGSDSRITPLGKVLRDSHIDELPQLFNVLAGDMSLVGPRPERPEFVAQLERKVAHYRQRLNVKPGITGLAQILLPPDSGIDSVTQKVIHDVYYVRHCSPFLDFKLVVATGWKVLTQLARHAFSVFSLPDAQRIAHGFSQAVAPPRGTGGDSAS